MILKENIKYKIFESAKGIDFEEKLNDMLNFLDLEPDERSTCGDSIGAVFLNNDKKFRVFVKTVDYKNALAVIGTVQEVKDYENEIVFGTIKIKDEL